MISRPAIPFLSGPCQFAVMTATWPAASLSPCRATPPLAWIHARLRARTPGRILTGNYGHHCGRRVALESARMLSSGRKSSPNTFQSRRPCFDERPVGQARLSYEQLSGRTSCPAVDERGGSVELQMPDAGFAASQMLIRRPHAARRPQRNVDRFAGRMQTQHRFVNGAVDCIREIDRLQGRDHVGERIIETVLTHALKNEPLHGRTMQTRSLTVPDNGSSGVGERHETLPASIPSVTFAAGRLSARPVHRRSPHGAG